MEILIAEDDTISCHILETFLRRWGYDVLVAQDGTEAYRQLDREDRPALAILDWMMPGMDGVQICQKVRQSSHTRPIHLILLTARNSKADIVEGLEAGADDYIAKPFDQEELRMRIQVGVRLVELQRNLAERVRELGEAMGNIKQLRGMLPICSYCKKIRDDQNYWQQVENYISKHSDAQFSHGVCPGCYQTIVEPELRRLVPEEQVAR